MLDLLGDRRVEEYSLDVRGQRFVKLDAQQKATVAYVGQKRETGLEKRSHVRTATDGLINHGDMARTLLDEGANADTRLLLMPHYLQTQKLLPGNSCCRAAFNHHADLGGLRHAVFDDHQRSAEVRRRRAGRAAGNRGPLAQVG